jgi:hypothetical protein
MSLIKPWRMHRGNEELEGLMRLNIYMCHAREQFQVLTCEPFVSGPALAIDSNPGLSCFSLKFSSEIKGHVNNTRDSWIQPHVRTIESCPVDRAAAGPIMSCKIATLQHELTKR